MIEENQTNLEAKLRGLSANFTHEDKAYTLLSRAAKKGVLPEIEEQLAVMLEKVGKTTDKNIPRLLSVQLLIDYLERGHKLYQAPFTPGQSGHVDLRYPFTTDGLVTCPSLDDYDDYKESEKEE